MSRLLPILIAAALLAVAPSAQAKSCDGATTVITGNGIAGAKKALRCLIDNARREAGLAGFTTSRKLGHIARDYAGQMRDEDFFGHTTPSGETRKQRFAVAGYHHRGAENLGYGYTTPQQLFDSWMASSIHRGNILSKRWRFIGIGIALGGSRSPLWDVSFGRRRS